MKCPVDGTTLLLAERQGIEIDYCPECRGVWLDRGELDKLVHGTDEREDEEHRSGDGDGDAPRGKKKKKGWLSEILEFGE
jgi:Zn-finger nucleic acid-binding protein